MINKSVSPDSFENAIDWAADVLCGRFDEVYKLRQAALQTEDIEGVHQMRVAIRRLRSALRDFSPLLKRRAFTKSRRDLKKLGNALGTARDLDVAIAALTKLKKKAKNEIVKKDIELKTEIRLAQRQKVQTILKKTLEISAFEKMRERFLRAVETAVKANGKTAALSAKEAGNKVILKSIEEFCELSDSLYNPFDCENLHKLRIAAKRLRYTIEIFKECFSDEFAPFAQEITEMQTFLGELHDRDIWIENFSRRLHKTTDKTRLADFWLLSHFVKERTKNYRAALNLWSKWQKNDFLQKLQEILKPYIVKN